MQSKEQEFWMKTSAIASILFVIGVVIAIRMKKGFWVALGFGLLGSIAGGAIGRLVFKYPDNTIN